MPPKQQAAETGKAGEETRKALIAAGIRLFGQKGFEATSTREIAALAQANIASIAYHFGGKEGLRLACAEAVCARIQGVIGPALEMIDPGDDPCAAQAMVETALAGMVGFLLGQAEARDIAGFLIREFDGQGPVFDRLYSGFILPVHRKLCFLLGLATGQDPESDLIRLGAFSIAGQIVYFRVGHAIVARRMEWTEAGPEEIARIKSVLLGNVRAFVDSNRKPVR